MKLCGGYDFPGSNSGVDLFSLTGWIPERIHFPEDENDVRDHETPTERAWERLYNASSYGDCLITAATSTGVSQETADKVGLITGHAYAVLSVVKTKDGTRLLQMKNPWAHKSWSGRFSSFDKKSWSLILQDEVGYDPKKASKCDDGVFFICWQDVSKYFQNLYLSWNPALFSSRVTTHAFWPKSQGPKKDTFNCGENPQYILSISDAAIKKKATIWILLSRHVTKQEQEGSENKDFLALHIHRNKSNKHRIWYPCDDRIVTGAYTNNQHILVRYDVESNSDKYLSLVLSQYDKHHDLGLTLSCFGTGDFNLRTPVKLPPNKIQVSGDWKPGNSGGPPHSKRFGCNPMWSFEVSSSDGAFIHMRCSAVKDLATNIMLVKTKTKNSRISTLKEAPILDSGDYRRGFAATQVQWIPNGNYSLVVSCFHPGKVGAFFIDINSTIPKLSLSPIK